MSVSNEILREEIRILKEEVDQLREENRQLRSQLVPKEWEVPLEFSLTQKEKIIFAALYKSEGEISKEALLNVLYQFYAADEVPQIKIIDVFVCKIRKKIAVYDITIDTVWGKGYVIPRASREILKNWGQELDEAA